MKAVLVSLTLCLLLPYGTGLHAQDAKEFALGKAENLGSPVNTKNHAEVFPAVSPDGNVLIFQCDREAHAKWHLYASYRTRAGWSAPKLLESITTDVKDLSPFISYDGNYLLYSSYRSGGEGHIDIWMAERKGDTWGEPRNLGKPVNTDGYDAIPSLSPDGTELYFVRESKGSRGCSKDDALDIYVSKRVGKRWSKPQRLPGPINSEYCEGYPLILPDGVTLLFSSNRPGGYGGFDLYKSVRLANGTWTIPENLGSFINTEWDETRGSVPASGDVMYYTSGGVGSYAGSRTSWGSNDLYMVSIPPDMRPVTMISVAGTVTDAGTGRALQAIISIVDQQSGEKVKVLESNNTDGRYIALLNKGAAYDVSVSAEGYTFYSTRFDLRELDSYEKITRNIALQPLKAGASIVLHNVYFSLDSDNLLDESKYELARLVDMMKKNPTMVVEIAGHTDNTASDAYNKDLSTRRAQAVARYLETNGVAAKRLTTKGYGESRPIADNATEEGRSQNRRVEFTIVKK